MIGVVVWASVLREKAIIWCEDQATLAYLQGRDNLAAGQRAWPLPGDLVELETETLGSLRHARGVSLISEQHCPELPKILAAAEEPDTERGRLRVVSSSDARRSSLQITPDLTCFPRSGAAS